MKPFPVDISSSRADAEPDDDYLTHMQPHVGAFPSQVKTNEGEILSLKADFSDENSSEYTAAGSDVLVVLTGPGF